uniref:Uncharacterized protein n=1 Tax=Hanusia phi TaxID=3032 RepID=A0A7S0HAF9_9CRYP|mmetsp:Transcript_10272/g.23458  ORF Transcript_10272/g.23458 Transcript_10272/m.23458 type:complete len:108 (+) Transcript_10272:51-374(+)|eukprot:376307-Hanusia_phi.AAC.2
MAQDAYDQLGFDDISSDEDEFEITAGSWFVSSHGPNAKHKICSAEDEDHHKPLNNQGLWMCEEERKMIYGCPPREKQLKALIHSLYLLGNPGSKKDLVSATGEALYL